MGAELLLRERHQLGQDAFAEIVIWRLPSPVRASEHRYKYRLAYVVEERCEVRYDNEAGKGDHLHMGLSETPYTFIDPTTLLRDFWEAIDQWQRA